MDRDEHLEEVAAIARAWGVEVVDCAPVPGGSLNSNDEVQSGAGPYFLRRYRDNLETERIEGEHDLVRWAVSEGLPAPLPLSTRAGPTVLVEGPGRWALFPWVANTPAVRGQLSTRQVRALGSAHGRLQATLARHPLSAGARFTQRWDATRSASGLAQLIETAAERREEAWIVDGMRRQLHLLERTDLLPPAHFAQLPCQLLHGDFHDLQVLFRDEKVVAIVDWEIWHEDARAWELVRSLAFSLLLDSPQMDGYLAGYREHVQLEPGEVELALTLWFQGRLVNTWAWWTYLMEGNHRLGAFFPESIAELERMADPSWTLAMRERFARAAYA